jgi:hypothetical protein
MSWFRGNFSYPNAIFGSMTLPFATQTLAFCCDPNPAGPKVTDQDCLDSIGYSGMYSQFFLSDNPPVDFDYKIVTIANSTSLRITKGNGDYAIYNNAPLSTPDFYAALDSSLAANRIGEKLLLNSRDLTDIHQIFLYNLEGKMIISTVPDKDFIDISSLSKGLYFLILHDSSSSKTLKFIKK